MTRLAAADPVRAAAALDHLSWRRRHMAAQLEAAHPSCARALRVALRLVASANRADVRAQLLREGAALAA